ncbi:MAG: hypothetical protein WAV28_06545 [Sedimentisphaerales bacterium]
MKQQGNPQDALWHCAAEKIDLHEFGVYADSLGIGPGCFGMSRNAT